MIAALVVFPSTTIVVRRPLSAWRLLQTRVQHRNTGAMGFISLDRETPTALHVDSLTLGVHDLDHLVAPAGVQDQGSVHLLGNDGELAHGSTVSHCLQFLIALTLEEDTLKARVVSLNTVSL